MDQSGNNNPLTLKNILAGIIVTVIGGFILMFLVQDARFDPSRNVAGNESDNVPISIDSQDFGCDPDDFVPNVGGGRLPIGKTICIPSGAFAWVSSDASKIDIPGVYELDSPIGFTFSLFGPVRFTISEVEEQNVWIDMQSNTNTRLLGDPDNNKSLIYVYHEGKVCEYGDFTTSGCP